MENLCCITLRQHSSNSQNYAIVCPNLTDVIYEQHYSCVLLINIMLQADPGPRVCWSVHQGLLLAGDAAGDVDIWSQGL